MKGIIILFLQMRETEAQGRTGLTKVGDKRNRELEGKARSGKNKPAAMRRHFTGHG